MNTLRIEHPVTDYSVWKGAFDRFADMRSSAGVRSHVIRRPIDDPHYVIADLDFDSAQEAEAFLETLRTRVWSTPANSPALAGDPVTRILATEEGPLSTAPRGGLTDQPSAER
ncbi:MAG: hypothetical protein ABIW80_11465 [Lapillicoccus sp.]